MDDDHGSISHPSRSRDGEFIVSPPSTSGRWRRAASAYAPEGATRER